MDKKIAGLLGAAAALATVSGAQATMAAAEPPAAASYRDLLEPVPNAVAALQADDARLAKKPVAEGTEVAQVVVMRRHHHHHHHRWWRRRWHHHHHHHHHHW